MNVKVVVDFLNLGARSKSHVNIGERASHVDDVGGYRAVRTSIYHSSSDQSSPHTIIGPSHDSSSASPSHKRSRSPVAFVPLSSPILGALSYACVDLLPSSKRIRSPETATDLEGCSEDSFEQYVPREAGLGVDFKDESSESSRHKGTNLEMDVEVMRSDGIDIDPEI
ncbi:hypothetical protein Tco_1300758 [Tanacetum coccineum]